MRALLTAGILDRYAVRGDQHSKVIDAVPCTDDMCSVLSVAVYARVHSGDNKFLVSDALVSLVRTALADVPRRPDRSDYRANSD